MDRPLLVFTDNFDRANKEIESKGGRVVHRLGRGILVVNLPKPTKISNLDTCDSKMPAWLDDEEKLIVKAWKATAASKGTELLSLMTRSTREGVKWSESGFQAPGSDDPGRRPRGEARSPVSRAARSTGIATSLYMTGSVAVGIIIVSGDSWHKIPGGLKCVSAASDGTVWGVNKNDDIYRRVGNSWQKVSGGLKQISVGSASQIWGVNKNDNIYRRVGNSWQKVSGGLKHVSVASDGTVWGVNKNDDIYRRVGNSWQQVSGGLKQISVGSASQIWGVNNADNIYERKILATA